MIYLKKITGATPTKELTCHSDTETKYLKCIFNIIQFSNISEVI